MDLANPMFGQTRGEIHESELIEPEDRGASKAAWIRTIVLILTLLSRGGGYFGHARPTVEKMAE